jgi:hypothetical protein
MKKILNNKMRIAGLAIKSTGKIMDNIIKSGFVCVFLSGLTHLNFEEMQEEIPVPCSLEAF